MFLLPAVRKKSKNTAGYFSALSWSDVHGAQLLDREKCSISYCALQSSVQPFRSFLSCLLLTPVNRARTPLKPCEAALQPLGPCVLRRLPLAALSYFLKTKRSQSSGDTVPFPSLLVIFGGLVAFLAHLMHGADSQFA